MSSIQPTSSASTQLYLSAPSVIHATIEMVHPQRRVWAAVEPIAPQVSPVRLTHPGICPYAIAPLIDRSTAMKSERITLPIYNLGCGGGGTLAIERALMKAPGVVQAYINPLTEMVYIVYNPAAANPEQLAGVIDRIGYGAARPKACHDDAATTAPISGPPLHRRRNIMYGPQTSGIGAFLRSRTGIALLVFLVIAAFYLVTEHTAHVFSLLPYGLILLCPLMHLLMHGGHGGHAGDGDHSGHENHSERTEEDQR